MTDPREGEQSESDCDASHSDEHSGEASQFDEASQYRDAAHALVGTRLADRYLVHQLIGVGGMGAVFEGEHIQLQKRVAIKVLHEHMGENAQVVARFEREAVAAGRIRHPGVVAATDFGRLPDGSFYLVLEYVEGRDLHSLLDEVGTLEPERAFRIAYQISEALVAAHREGIIHRDLKPENVMLVEAGEDDDYVKVLDFGIAKLRVEELSDQEERLTQVGVVFGTAEYMSPEQARGETVDLRTDIYAVGMMLYEMLEGRTAFAAEEVMAVLTAQMWNDPPALTAAAPEALIRLVDRTLAKDPAQRPQTAEALSEELARIAMEQGWGLPHPRTVTSRYGSAVDIRRPAAPLLSLRPLAVRNTPIPWWIPIAGLLLGLGLGAFFMFRAPQDEPGQQQEAALDPREVERQLLADARSGDRDALAELRRSVEQQRRQVAAAGAAGSEPSIDWAARFMALGRGYSVIRHYSAALDAYEQAVLMDPHLAQEGELLVDVRVAIEKRDAVDQGLAFAHQHLGAHGADLIYDVWRTNLGQPGWTPVVARAQRYVRGGRLLPIASPALKVALQLDRAQLCGEYRALLARAVQEADERSVPTLEALTRRTGCGSGAREDCFPCLRKPAIPLQKALRAAQSRRKPQFLIREESKPHSPQP